MNRFFRKIKLKHIIIFSLIVFAVTFVLLLFFGFLYAPSKIEGDSMENTIYDHDWIILDKVKINQSEPERGEIVILEGEPKKFTLFTFLNKSDFMKRFLPAPIGEDWIKRIIAVGGDTVDIINDSIYINGEKLNEPYLKEENHTYERHLIEFPYLVPDGEYFVMGDNRIVSHDSRNFGSVKREIIIGTSEIRIWPIKRVGRFE